MESNPNQQNKIPIVEIPKVLIADDNPSMRHLLHAAISQWGYEVIEASDGEEAWEIMQLPNSPRLLILDWLMPNLDGITLCERLRKKLDYYPYIIFLTEVSGTTNIIRGIEAGADEFLLKPVNFFELRTRLFSGEKIIEYQKRIVEQKQQLQALQYLLLMLLKENRD